MTETELALRAALNVLRDSVESSGEPLADDARTLHERAIDTLEDLLRRESGLQ